MAERLVVSAADMARSFAKWRDASRIQPVFVSNHGRETHVLLGTTLFDSLRARSVGSENKSDDLITVADWVENAMIICDAAMRIIFANRVTASMAKRALHEAQGKPLIEALPELGGTLFEMHARQAAQTGEPGIAELPSPFTPGAWLRLHAFPLINRTVIMLRDITADVQNHRMADVKAALIDAMALHGKIGYVRINTRGLIDRIDAPLCEVLGMAEDRLLGVALADLVARADRPAFRETIEQVLTGSEGSKIEVRFVSNKGELAPVMVALKPLHGAYGNEGALMLTVLPESA